MVCRVCAGGVQMCADCVQVMFRLCAGGVHVMCRLCAGYSKREKDCLCLFVCLFVVYMA